MGVHTVKLRLVGLQCWGDSYSVWVIESLSDLRECCVSAVCFLLPLVELYKEVSM